MTDDQLQAFMELVVSRLTEIRDVLVGGIQAAEDVDEGCHHPADRRVDLSTMNDLDHWVCAICKYDHRGVMST